ncbi:hypothetical protein HDE_04067 [Halotydeus destructor]|nr:hypothetical protein HDE_04067 [Halotydeus destructor]
MKLTLLILFTIYLNCALGCRCIPPDAKRSYCANNYTGVVTVDSGPRDCDNFQKCYDVTVVKALKTQPGMVVSKLTTSRSSASCGRSYSQGGTYLITGNPQEDGSIRTNSCGYGEHWTEKSEVEKAEREAFFESIECDTQPE